MINLAVVGCGRIGVMHAANIMRHDETSLAGVFDINVAGARQFAESTNAYVFDSFSEIVNSSEIDGIVVASATETHADYIEQAVDAGVAVLCEKPIDLDLDRVDRCSKAISDSVIPVQIGFNRRFDPGHSAAHSTAHSGEIGEIIQVIITSRDPSMPPRQYLEQAGGLLRDMTIHDFDLARFMLGEEPAEIFATVERTMQKKLLEELDDHDTAMIILRTQSGKQCIINNSRQAVYGYDQRIEILGTKGMVISDNRRPTEVKRFGQESTNCAAPLLHFFVERYEEAFMAEISHFADCIKSSRTPCVGFEDGRAALILAEAAYLSVRERRVVKIDEVY